jgi:hypothetical protein
MNLAKKLGFINIAIETFGIKFFEETFVAPFHFIQNLSSITRVH